MATYLPTISNSLSVACFLIRLHMSIVNRVEALLKMDVNELITAAIITATIRPRMPVTYHRKHQVDINIENILRNSSNRSLGFIVQGLRTSTRGYVLRSHSKDQSPSNINLKWTCSYTTSSKQQQKIKTKYHF